MELSQLRYFVTVAGTQHLTRAAEELNISQPALSKAISRLEEELGTPLFDRTPNRILLNSSGKQYLAQIQEALKLMDIAGESVRQKSGTVHGNVSIMTSCSGILQGAIRDFLTSHPDIHYHQYRYSASHIMEQLENGMVDLAVTNRPAIMPQCSWTTLYHDSLYVVAADENPISGMESVSMDRLSREYLIIANTLLSVHEIVSEGFLHTGYQPQIAYELNNPPLIEQLLTENRGVAFVPGFKVEERSDSLAKHRRLIPVEGDPFAYEMGILKLRSRFQRPVARMLENFLTEWFSVTEHILRTSTQTDTL